GSGVSTGNDGSATAGTAVSISVPDTASDATVATGVLTTSTDAVISQVLTGYAAIDETQWQVGSSLDSSSNDELGVLGVHTLHDELWAG
ncbi:hypothetical protein Lrub_0434, partial [Legionella rubrilucens]